MNLHLRNRLRTIVPRIQWTVVERDGQPELVIWRQWLGHAYDIRSLAGSWGRWDRTRIEHEGPTTITMTDTQPAGAMEALCQLVALSIDDDELESAEITLREFARGSAADALAAARKRVAGEIANYNGEE